MQRVFDWYANKKETARFFGVSPQALDGWISRGCPVERNGRALKFYLPEATAWKLSEGKTTSSGLDLTAERARLAKEQADKAAMDNKRASGEFVLASQAADILQKIVMAFRSKVLSIPTKAAPLIHGCKTLAETRDSLEVALFEALNELAETPLANLSTAESGSNGKATAKANGKRVGRQRAKTKPGGKLGARTVAN